MKSLRCMFRLCNNLEAEVHITKPLNEDNFGVFESIICEKCKICGHNFGFSTPKDTCIMIPLKYKQKEKNNEVRTVN